MFHRVQRRVRQAQAAEGGARGQYGDGSATRTFGYGQGRFWSMVTFGVGIFLSLAFAVSDWHTPLGGGLIFVGVCIALIVFLEVFVVKLPALFLSAGTVALDTRRRRAERITTSCDSITFDDGRRHIAAAWNEVTGHFIQESAQSPTLREAALSSSLGRAARWIIAVETEQSCFQYSLFIEDEGRLCRTIGERAIPLRKRDSFEGVLSVTFPGTCLPSADSPP